jgi:hypothetical protein
VRRHGPVAAVARRFANLRPGFLLEHAERGPSLRWCFRFTAGDGPGPLPGPLAAVGGGGADS